MKKYYNIKTFFALFLLLGLATNNMVWSQKTDIDSLLTVATRETKDKNYPAALKKTHLGMKLAPEYLDYYLLTGRIYQLTSIKDSARYYYNYVISKNVVYEDAFTYLINMDIEEKDYDTALVIVNKAIEAHPDKKEFRYKKLSIYELQGEKKKSELYVAEMRTLFPNDNEFKLNYFIESTKTKSDRIGVNYNYTSFDREGYGPWHYGSLQYIHQRNWGAAIGRINYTNRLSNLAADLDGVQYEVESYIFTGKNSYSYLSASYSSDPIFPKLRLGYSFYYNFKKGWEADLGLRYIDVGDDKITTLVVGAGKYIGSYWFHLKSYLQYDDATIYPAFTLTTRYYFNTRFDYLTAIAGYGTSPDERTTAGLIGQRISLNSYRLGLGYYRIFANHYLTGLQLNYNNQEYIAGKIQNEVEIALMLQYHF